MVYMLFQRLFHPEKNKTLEENGEKLYFLARNWSSLKIWTSGIDHWIIDTLKILPLVFGLQNHVDQTTAHTYVGEF